MIIIQYIKLSFSLNVSKRKKVKMVSSMDEESATLQSQELKRKKRIKLGICIAVFAVSQVIVNTLFGLVVMRVKSPKLRLSNIQIQNLATGSSTSLPNSFDMSFTTQVRVKNSNFGPYKYDNTTVVFTLHGTTVGELAIPKGSAGMKSIKNINNLQVRLNSQALPSTAGTELNSGVLRLSSRAKMTGKVELMMIMKKKKSAEMECTIVIDVSTKATVRSLECK